MAKTEYWNGQKVLYYTVMFGKEYVFMQDHDGTTYAVRAVPVYDAEGNLSGYRPKFA